MALDKAIAHGHEHRKPYTGTKAFDPTCRNHGSCEWCRRNRMRKFVVRERMAEDKLLEYMFVEEETE